MNLEKKIGLKESEEIVAVIRRHGIFRSAAYFLSLLILVVMAFFLFWLLQQGLAGFILIVSAALLAVAIAARAWFADRRNFAVLTTARLVDVGRIGLFTELVSAMKYDNIKDIYIKKRGLAAGLFDYGDVIVEIKSDKSILELVCVAHPLRVQNLIEECRENYFGRENLSDKETIREAFIKLIPDLDEEELYEVKDFLDARLEEVSADDDGFGSTT